MIMKEKMCDQHLLQVKALYQYGTIGTKLGKVIDFKKKYSLRLS